MPEHELKLIAARDVDDAQVAALARGRGLAPAAASTWVQVDVYLDTAELDLQRAGWALRLRERSGDLGRDDGHRRVLAAKGRATGHDAVWVRDEAEVPWPAAPPPGHARELPAELRHRLAPYALDRPLVERLRLETRRTRVPLRSAAGAAELCIDRVLVPQAPADRQRFCELEIEFEGGADPSPWLELAHALKQELQLEDSLDDKLVRALALTGRPSAPEPEPVLTGDTPIRIAAFLVFREQLARVRQHEPGVRLATDVEELHDMRVAARRLRAALRTFRDVFPEPALQPLIALAGRTRRALGPLRDLDVLRASLAELRRSAPATLQSGLDRLDREFAADRDRRHARLVRFLEHPARTRALQRAVTWLERGPGAGGDATVAQLAPAWIRAAARRALQQGRRCTPGSPVGQWHELRIALKRLRYALDAFRPLHATSTRSLTRKLARLQDLLGTHHDAHVAAETLERRTHVGAGHHDRDLDLAAGALLGSQLARAQDALAGFAKAWRKLDRPKVRERLERALAE